MFTQEAVRALIMSFIAGVSTLIGAFSVFIPRRRSQRLLSIALGFAGGVMISVSFDDLLPNANQAFASVVGRRPGLVLMILFLALGIFLAGMLDRFVPHQQFDTKNRENPHPDLFRVGFISMLAIGLHNFPEGIATFMAGYENMALGMSITVAIAMHNIPEGISVAMPIYFATGSRWKAFRYTFLSGMAEPVGALLAFLILHRFLTPFLMGVFFALISGIMLYIAIEELLPSSRQYGYRHAALVAVFAGICIMPLSNLW